MDGCFCKIHLYYDDIIYDPAFNNYFLQKIEFLQYNITLATTGAIGGTQRKNNYQKLDLESLQQKRW